MYDVINWNEQCNHEIKQFTADSGASTNKIEGAWSHLKRHQRGIYHLLSRKYSQYYIDEFVYRWNTRNISPPERIKEYFPNVRVVIPWKELIEISYVSFTQINKR